MRVIQILRAIAITSAIIFAINLKAVAVEPGEILDDPVLEARAREISEQLRCLVCQNENIDSSNASLAKDLRVLVRERLVAGDSNDEIFAFVVERYGDYVLLKPPLKGTTFILWFSPVILLLIAGSAAFLLLRANGLRAETVTLDDAEESRLKDLTGPEE